MYCYISPAYLLDQLLDIPKSIKILASVNYCSSFSWEVIANNCTLLITKLQPSQCFTQKLTNMYCTTLTFLAYGMFLFRAPARTSAIICMEQTFIMGYQNMKTLSTRKIWINTSIHVL